MQQRTGKASAAFFHSFQLILPFVFDNNSPDLSWSVCLAVGILCPSSVKGWVSVRIPGLWWGAQHWRLKVDQMVGCGTLCWQWLLSDNDCNCCWGHWCSVKSQWSPDWLGDHSDWFIFVPCCSLNILNITSHCIIKWSMTLECWTHSIHYYEEG